MEMAPDRRADSLDVRRMAGEVNAPPHPAISPPSDGAPPDPTGAAASVGPSLGQEALSVGSRALDDPEQAVARAGSGVWMTKAELARVRRISVASADRLIRRQRWRKQPGNDGRARVPVPRDWAMNKSGMAPEHPTDAPPGDPTDKTPRQPADPTDIRRIISALEAALQMVSDRADAEIAALRGQLTSVEARGDAERADRIAAQDRADRHRDRADAAEAVARALTDRMAQAKAGEATAQTRATRAEAALTAERAERMRTEQDRRARGVLARIRAALRGE